LAGSRTPLPPSVLAIFGPTASGKTAVAEELVRRIPAEIVSADSMQVYRGLPILTNHGPGRLVGIWEPDRQRTVGEYAPLAHAAIDEILAAGRTPLVVGGSGLWFRAALVELGLPAEAGDGRARWEHRYDELGADAAHRLLAGVDPGAAEVVHANDRRRVVRALELAEAGSSLRPSEGRLWSDETRHPTTIVGLEVPPGVLAARIEERTRRMFEAGVEEEARAAGEVAPKVIGLEAVRTLPRAEAEAELNVATRQLAAYQRKWMRRIPGLVSVAADRPPSEVADAVLEVASAGQRVPADRAG